MDEGNSIIEPEIKTVYREAPKKKGSFWKNLLKVILVIVLGGASGFGGAYMYGKYFTSETDDSKTVLYEAVNTNAVISGTTSDIGTVVYNVKDSVVQIETEYVKTSSYFGNYVTSGAGSGVIVTANGYIVTNNHVIEDATSILVRLADGTEYEGTLIARDEDTDLAVIKIEATGLLPAVMGSSDSTYAGESVIVIGNPLGTLGGSVTSGIISALSREITIDSTTMNLLQIDAAVNPGNSGGALFDLSGTLIGIVNAKYEDESVEGIGFAIPIDTVKKVVEDLITKGYVTGKVALGVSIVDITTRQQAFRYGVDEYGTYISKINSGSDAETAGLKVGDRVISVDGENISSASDLVSAVKSHSVGDTVTIVVVRNSEELTIEVFLTEQGKPAN